MQRAGYRDENEAEAAESRERKFRALGLLPTTNEFPSDNEEDLPRPRTPQEIEEELFNDLLKVGGPVHPKQNPKYRALVHEATTADSWDDRMRAIDEIECICQSASERRNARLPQRELREAQFDDDMLPAHREARRDYFGEPLTGSVASKRGKHKDSTPAVKITRPGDAEEWQDLANDVEAIRAFMVMQATKSGYSLDDLSQPFRRGPHQTEEENRRRDDLSRAVYEARGRGAKLEAIGTVINRTKPRVLELARRATRSAA